MIPYTEMKINFTNNHISLPPYLPKLFDDIFSSALNSCRSMFQLIFYGKYQFFFQFGNCFTDIGTNRHTESSDGDRYVRINNIVKTQFKYLPEIVFRYGHILPGSYRVSDDGIMFGFFTLAMIFDR